jgi:hypothetical protein
MRLAQTLLYIFAIIRVRVNKIKILALGFLVLFVNLFDEKYSNVHGHWCIKGCLRLH